jgi:hypothetical protein
MTAAWHDMTILPSLQALIGDAAKSMPAWWFGSWKSSLWEQPGSDTGAAHLARDDADDLRLGRGDEEVVQAHGPEQAIRPRQAGIAL